MTNALYPYRSIYSYPNDDQPLPVISRPPYFSAPQAFPLSGTTVVPLIEARPDLPVTPVPPVAPPAANVATIRVILPDPSAKVSLAGRPTASLGRERTFYSPPLEAGGKYSYEVIAE